MPRQIQEFTLTLGYETSVYVPQDAIGVGVWQQSGSSYPAVGFDYDNNIQSNMVTRRFQPFMSYQTIPQNARYCGSVTIMTKATNFNTVTDYSTLYHVYELL